MLDLDDDSVVVNGVNPVLGLGHLDAIWTRRVQCFELSMKGGFHGFLANNAAS
jgi:hypothetical protein